MSEKELLSRITTDPQICHGKPCIRGLRYPVEFILEMLSGPTSVGEFLKDYIKEGDVILVKGSQSMRMEKAVALILEDKENIKKLLVRQEREWKVR